MIMVAGAGLEPACSEERRLLRTVCLPAFTTRPITTNHGLSHRFLRPMSARKIGPVPENWQKP